MSILTSDSKAPLDIIVSNADNEKISSSKLRYGLAPKFSFTNKQRRFCGYAVRNKVHLHDYDGSLSLEGVQTCKSVWSCPHCSAKILSQRSEEFQFYIDSHLYSYEGFYVPGRFVLMVTLTAPHHRGHDLNEFLGSRSSKSGLLGAAGEFFGKSHDWKRNFKPFIKHYVAGKECTYGANGHHAHIHALLFVDVRNMPKKYWTFKGKKVHLNLDFLKKDLFQAWEKDCQRVGLGTPSIKAFDLTIAKSAGHYIAKWSASNELSSPQAKTGKNSGQSTMRQIEVEAYHGKASKENMKALQSYYENFHGKRCHNKSRSLSTFKAIFDKGRSQAGKFIGLLKASDYNKLVKADILPEVLSVYKNEGLYAFTCLLYRMKIPLYHENSDFPEYRFIPGKPEPMPVN